MLSLKQLTFNSQGCQCFTMSWRRAACIAVFIVAAICITFQGSLTSRRRLPVSETADGCNSPQGPRPRPRNLDLEGSALEITWAKDDFFGHANNGPSYESEVVCITKLRVAPRKKRNRSRTSFDRKKRKEYDSTFKSHPRLCCLCKFKDCPKAKMTDWNRSAVLSSHHHLSKCQRFDPRIPCKCCMGKYEEDGTCWAANYFRFSQVVKKEKDSDGAEWLLLRLTRERPFNIKMRNRWIFLREENGTIDDDTVSFLKYLDVSSKIVDKDSIIKEILGDLS